MAPREPTQGPSQGDGSKRRSKVAQDIEFYGLDGFGARLEHLWTGAEGDRYSLRELAKWFNHHLVESAMEAAGMDSLQGEIDTIYRLLTDDGVSSGQRVQICRRLEREGIDVERLQRDFVSHQAVHTYLTAYRQASLPENRITVSREANKLTRLQHRMAAVTEDSISRLATKDLLDVGEFDVFVDVSVLCRDCGASFALAEFLEEGRCNCALEEGD